MTQIFRQNVRRQLTQLHTTTDSHTNPPQLETSTNLLTTNWLPHTITATAMHH